VRRYPDIESAFRRVTAIRRTTGAWPGVIGPDRDGRFRLTWDPLDGADDA